MSGRCKAVHELFVYVPPFYLRMEKEILSVADEMKQQVKAITACLENDEPVKYIRYTRDGTITVTIEKEGA